MKYVKLKDEQVFYDGKKFIPADEKNVEYRNVIAWMKKGNEMKEVENTQ